MIAQGVAAGLLLASAFDRAMAGEWWWAVAWLVVAAWLIWDGWRGWMRLVDRCDEKREAAYVARENLMCERHLFRVALGKYGYHAAGCRFTDGGCDCGLDDVRARLARAVGAESREEQTR